MPATWLASRLPGAGGRTSRAGVPQSRCRQGRLRRRPMGRNGREKGELGHWARGHALGYLGGEGKCRLL